VNQGQRIVLVFALGIALFAIASCVNLLLLDRVGPGWFDYAPNTGVTTSQTDTYFVVADDDAIVRQAGIWLLALATWAGASLWLLRAKPVRGGIDE
jgi:hypothetical protein